MRQDTRPTHRLWSLALGFCCTLAGCGPDEVPAAGGAQFGAAQFAAPVEPDLVDCSEPVGGGFPNLSEIDCSDQQFSSYCDLALPVCGENGRDYFNPYFACQQVPRYAVGPCRGIVQCREAVPPDAFCPAVYEPVCGENGENFANTCEACKVVERYDKGGLCRGSVFEQTP